MMIWWMPFLLWGHKRCCIQHSEWGMSECMAFSTGIHRDQTGKLHGFERRGWKTRTAEKLRFTLCKALKRPACSVQRIGFPCHEKECCVWWLRSGFRPKHKDIYIFVRQLYQKHSSVDGQQNVLPQLLLYVLPSAPEHSDRAATRWWSPTILTGWVV